MARLCDLAAVIRGVTFDKEEALDQPGSNLLPILRAGNIQETLLLGQGLVYVPMRRVSEEQRLRDGDIAICMSSGSIEIVGKTATIEGDWDGSVGAFCAIIRPRNGATAPGYVAAWLRSPIFRQWTRRADGLNIKNIRRSELEQLEVQLPPLEEQRRIVDLLDRAASIRRLRRQAQETARQIGHALFTEVVGDISTNPHSWPMLPFGSLIAGFEGGKSMRPDGETEKQARYRVLKLSAVTSGRFRSDEAKPVPAAYEPHPTHIIRHGDLLITRSNTAELVGASCLVETPPNNLLMPDLIWRIVWKDVSPVLPAFLVAVLQHPTIRPRISALATGTSDSMRKLSQGRLATLHLPVPPLSVQQRFVVQATALNNILKAHAVAKVREDAMIQGLQARLFRSPGASTYTPVPTLPASNPWPHSRR